MTTPNDTNPPSVASGGSRPVAWAALDEDGQVAWIGYTEEGAKDGAAWRTVVPLYTHPVPPDRPVGLGFDDMRLTDAEREAIAWFAEYGDLQSEARRAESLKGLLERLG